MPATPTAFMRQLLHPRHDQDATPTRHTELERWLPVAVMAAVIAPIIVAAIRAAAGDWVPTGDDAYFTVRSRDVATAHHPLLGAWSSGSVDMTTPINNLGPMQLDLLAPFTKLAPMGGTAIAVALSNAAAVVAIAWIIARLAGRRAVVVAMGPLALLTWTLGSEMLITPRQHQFLILPYLCLLVAAWAVASGDRWAIVVAVWVGSLTAQTHLSYPVLVAALAAVMVVGQIVTTRSGEATGGRRPLAVSGALLVVLWSQTLIDQVAGSGNLGDVLFGSGEAGRAGLRTGVRIVAGILVSPITLARPGYAEFDTETRLASAWQVVVLVVAALAAVVVIVRGLGRGRWRAVCGLTVALVAVVAGVVDATLLPRSVFGLVIGNYRWLWATSAFVLIVVAVMITERLERAEPSPAWWSAGTKVVAAACGVLAVANLPTSVQVPDRGRYVEEQRAVASVLDQLAEVDIPGPVIVDESAMYFGHPYTYPVLLALQEQGVDFRFENPVQERRFGDGRLVDGSEVARLRLVSGDPALDQASAPDAVAFVAGTRPVVILLDDEG